MPLNELIQNVASTLMAADDSTSVTASERALQDVAAHLGLDVAFLRHNDHTIRATILIAQWPARDYIPDPDPIGTVYFENADPVFAMAEHIKEPVILRPPSEPDEFQQRIEEGTSIPAVSMAAVPLVVNDPDNPPEMLTTGSLGFIKFGDREWTDDEVMALKVIASMFAQLKARVEALSAHKHRAAHDDLTGLPNRRTLLTYLQDRLAPGQPGPVAVLSIDLDLLKAVNDLFGHDTGDQVLVDLCQRLREHTAGTAFLARLSGDEIIAVLDHPTALSDAHDYAEQLREAATEQAPTDISHIRTRVSIGVAVAHPGTDTVSDLLRYTGHALSTAKAAGGNTVAVFSDRLASQYDLHTDIEVHLHDCVDDNALSLHYLPEVDLRTGTLVAMEAVAQWQHPTRGVLSREQFMPVAEATNFAATLGREVLRLACQQLADWRQRGLAHKVMMRLKLTPAQVVTDSFTEHLEATLATFDIPPQCLTLELPEDLLVAEAARSQQIVLSLKRIGVHLALGNFGAGYSFLRSLKTLPIDSVKVGRTFVQTLDHDHANVTFIRSIAALADAFGLELTAEGLESESAAQQLVAAGYARAQGLLVSAPVDTAGMEQLLKAPTLRPPIPAA